MQFKCSECVHPEHEENRLELVILDGVIHKFYILGNGELEHCDSDGTGQEIYLECPLCGAKYDFEDDCGLILEEKYVLRKLGKYYDSVDLSVEDYKYKRR